MNGEGAELGSISVQSIFSSYMSQGDLLFRKTEKKKALNIILHYIESFGYRKCGSNL